MRERFFSPEKVGNEIGKKDKEDKGIRVTLRYSCSKFLHQNQNQNKH